MSTHSPTQQALLAENAELRARLENAEETLRAIRSGEIDALVVETATGPKIFTLQGQDAELNRFRGEILTQISDAVIVVDDDQRVTYLNAAAERQYGVTASEVLGCSIAQIYRSHWVQPDDETQMVAALNQTGRWRGENVHIKRNGEILHVESSVTRLYSGNGTPSGLLAVIRDITERERLEAKQKQTLTLLDTLLLTAPIGLAFLDRELRYIRINDRLAEMNGIPVEAHIGLHLSEIVPALLDNVQKVTNRILETGKAVCNYEFSCETTAAPGFQRYWNESWYPMQDSGGKVIGFGAVVEDITERKQAELALKDADRRKDEFLAMLAHELRNPLGPMRNVAQLLKTGSLEAARLSWCGDVVERQVGHLSQLVDDLLDISRITLGKIELKKEPLAVADFVLQVVESSRPLIDARRQQFSLTLPEQPLRVEGDRVRLTQIVSNLLNNAAKYTEQGGHISLTIEHIKDQVCIRVRDTGCGIESSALLHLFELFYQVDADISRSQGGLGIGLALVHKLVVMHGGDVQAFSAGLGQGSEFVVRLPLLSLPETTTAVATTDFHSSNGGLRILIVDDYYAAAESLAMLLEFKGHQVWIAHDGLSGIEMARAKQPQVVILDIGLPEMDGYEVAKKLRQCPELGDLFIIALSGYVPPNDPESLLATTGFNEYQVKPVDIETLQKLLEKCRTLIN
ncbi:MAG: PAS domain-containing protein [Methylobacter sp.]|nr:PAS domain-containing protein [Methylobacter sp.]